MSAPNNQQPTIHQIMVKMILDSQNNVNKLVAMQEQQMVYINTLFKQIIDESANPPNTGTAPTEINSAVSTETGTIKTGKPTDSKPISEENQTI